MKREDADKIIQLLGFVRFEGEVRQLEDFLNEIKRLAQVLREDVKDDANTQG